MGVLEREKIDHCGLAKDGTALLIMYCAGALGKDYQMADIGEKAETYLEFAQSGQLIERFPECRGKKVVFHVSCEYWPHSTFKPRFARMAEQLAQYDIELVVEVSKLRGPGGRFEYRTPA
jgi:hypothetical protein